MNLSRGTLRLLRKPPIASTRIQRYLNTMATPYAVKIAPDNTGLWRFGQDESAAEKATELLQKDIDQHHVFFNQDGFHNQYAPRSIIVAIHGLILSAA